MGVYQWKEGTRIVGDPQKVGQEIESLSVRTPEAIVKKAMDEETELHNCFTWDDEAAANKWRLQEARVVVNAIVTVEDTEDEPITYPTFESVVINNSRQYVSRQEWVQDEDLRSQVYAEIGQAIGQLQRKVETYRYLDGDSFEALQEHLEFARESIGV